jgi:hypothetical protein
MLGVYTSAWCENHYYVTHESQLQESTREALRAALPWPLKANAARCAAGCMFLNGLPLVSQVQCIGRCIERDAYTQVVSVHPANPSLVVLCGLLCTHKSPRVVALLLAL